MPYAGQEYYNALTYRIENTGKQMEHKAKNELAETDKKIEDAEAGGYTASFDKIFDKIFDEISDKKVAGNENGGSSLYIIIGVGLILAGGGIYFAKQKGIF